jgi:hypothetical protein
MKTKAQRLSREELLQRIWIDPERCSASLAFAAIAFGFR